MNVSLVVAAYPPDLDGIGDSAWWMGKTLATRQDVERPVTIFTREHGSHTPADGVEVVPFFDFLNPASFSSLTGHVESWLRELGLTGSKDVWMILHYNPFGYGRRGFCPWVPSTLRQIKKLRRPPKIAVMFHETTVPKWPWRFAAMYAWQYPIFRAVCRRADLAFVSTERWKPQVNRANPRLPCHHVPVGSNIPLSDVSQQVARQRLRIPPGALVLGVFGSAHKSRMTDWIAAVAQAATRRWPDVWLLYVGPEGKRLEPQCSGVMFRDYGPLPASEVGWHLRAMNVVLSPFVDGVSTRRTSIITAFQHGVPVVTTVAPWSDKLFLDAVPDSLALFPVGDLDVFVSNVVEWLQEHVAHTEVPDAKLTEFFSAHFAWDRLVERICQLTESFGFDGSTRVVSSAPLGRRA